MKTPTYVRLIVLNLALIVSSISLGQTYDPFTVRKNVEIKGSMVVVGNTIIGQDNQDFNDLSQDNQDISMQYIDIDSDATTFSSSSAELFVHPQEDGSPTTCYRVEYAALYWGAILQEGNRDDINNVKFKLPGATDYIDINGEIIYDAIVDPIPAEQNEPGNTPYACYAEVTELLQNLDDIEGSYTLANINSSTGFNFSTGIAAGWTLFVIYEDPNLNTKSFTTFDGFSHISSGHYEEVQVTGFTTPPAGHIDLQFAYATLDGDRTKRATKLEINGKEVTTPLRSANKFFGSVIENEMGVSYPRNPNSINTLGYDTGFLEIINSEPEYVKNNDIGASFVLQVAPGQADPIFSFFSAFAVDIIAPDIDLTKTVLDTDGNEIDGDDVYLGQNLFYEITYQNVGNDDVTQFTITDVLPDNIIFDPLTDIDLSNAGGATLLSYDPDTRTLVFSIPDESVEVGDPEFVIRLAIQVVPNCYDLSQACSNEIQNQAFATYSGVINPMVVEQEGSFATVECLGVPGSTNFIVDISSCNFEKTEVLCGASVDLVAADGYDTYTWSTSPTGSPVIGTGQTFTATQDGTYYVESVTNSTCISITEVFNVVLYESSTSNPIIPYADALPVCPNDGKVLPYIFLCGANDERVITTGISDAVSIIWEQLDESSCDAMILEGCANEDDSCSWNQVGSGPDFTVNNAGEFRIVINYPDGCFSVFYFNVYQNLLNPGIIGNDIICQTPGQITVTGVPSGYEYSLSPSGPFQISNTFNVDTPGYYTVYISQIDVDTNPCIFETPSIYIMDRDFNATTNVVQPICFGDKGSISIAANNALPQYYFSLYENGNLVNSIGPTLDSNYTFDNLNSGDYTVNVTTDDGCVYSEDIAIIEPPLLSVTAALTQPLDCTDGEITIYPVGGTPPYTYYINSTTVSQDTPIYNVTSPGVYDITIFDFNSCSASTSITVEQVLEPDFNVFSSNMTCFDSNDGTITIDVTNSNGNTILYSIDNGTSFQSSNVFSNLAPGNYEVVLEYTFGNQPCLTVPQLVTITAPDEITGTPELSAPYTCNSDGIISIISVSGGTPPYTYSIDGVNYQTSNTFGGLNPGTYSFTIQDANGCYSNIGSVVINNIEPITDLIIDHSQITCPSNTTTITITSVTGGSAPFEYQITAPAAHATAYQTSNSFSDLPPGTYSFQVVDSNNCTYLESYTVPPLTPLVADVVLTKGLDCSASPDAQFNGTITGDYPPFSVSLIQGSGTPTVTGNTFVFTTATSGTYQFEVTDSLGCIAQTGEIVIFDPVGITENITVIDPTCSGFNDGSITLNATSGQAPFQYSLDGGVTYVSTNVFGGLSSGTYNYDIQDSLGCNVTGSIVLNDPAPIDVTITSIPVQCNPTVLGSLEVSIDSGGIAPFTYTLFDNVFNQLDSITTVSTTHTFSGLSYGDYFVTIIDASGCEFGSNSVRIETPPNLNLASNVSAGTCVAGVDVEIQVVSGVGPFTYQIFGQPSTAFGPTASNSHIFTGLNHGVTYTFQVIDAGGCFSTIEVTTPTLSLIDINSVFTTDITCLGSDDGTLTFSVSDYDASVTSLNYEVLDQLTNTALTPAVNGTISGLTGTPVTETISGLPAGNYTILVSEADGTLCTISQPFQINQPIQPLLSVIVASSPANCNDTAQITLSTTGGSGPYQYAVGNPGFIPVSTDFNTNNVIDIDTSLGLSWDIVVVDSNNCEIRINEIVTIDPEPVIDASIATNCNIEEGNFEIDVTMVSPGIAPYTYSIDGGAYQSLSAPFTISNLSSGIHTIQVLDANGCGNLVSVSIEEPLVVLPEVSILPSCNNDDGVITINTTGGSGNFSYNINPMQSSMVLSGNTYSGVPTGIYTITVTDVVTTCFETVEVVVPEAIPLNLSTNPDSITCFNDNDGTFELNISGYSGQYTYEIVDDTNAILLSGNGDTVVSNPLLISGLPSGIYTVNVLELSFPFCSNSTSVIIPSPPEELTLSINQTSDVTCDNDQGTITAIANGGWGILEYELTGDASIPYSASNTFENLSAGTYTVNVRDEEGCIASETITLAAPPPISASVVPSTTLLACFGDTNASINVSNVIGGQGFNYTYTLNTITPAVSSSGPQTSPIFNGLGAGTYNVEISDGLNCVYTSADITINEPSPIEASLILQNGPTCTNQASLTLSATGGTGPYSYSESSTFNTIIGSFSSTIDMTVIPGLYSFYVQDANGCVSVVSNEINVEELPPLTLTLDASQPTINCVGDNTGVIIAEAQGGLGNYVYTLQDTSGNDITGSTQNTPGVFENLLAGDYQVEVESDDCIITSDIISITEPSVPLTATFNVMQISCSGSNDGVIEIIASGGTGIIKYAISPQMNQFFDDPIFDNLAADTYEVIVQDELGCYEILSITVSEPAPVIVNIVPNSMLFEVCTGDVNGEFSIDVSGGYLPYSVSLDSFDGPYITGSPTQTQFDFNGLEGGDHIVYVRDALNCQSEWNITFPEGVRIEADIEVDYCTNDNVSNSNFVTLSIDDTLVDINELDYALDGGAFQTETTFVNVTPGNHSVTIRHTNTCEQTIEFVVDHYDPLELTLAGDSINEIVATATGGSGSYDYEIQLDSTTIIESTGYENTVNIYESGNYTVVVTDSNGCTAFATQYFEYIDICISNYFTPNGDGNQDVWGPDCADNYPNLEFDVFDRYGRKVGTYNQGEYWDGRYNNKELPTGDYWFVVRLNNPQDNRTFVGHFTLYR